MGGRLTVDVQDGAHFRLRGGLWDVNLVEQDDHRDGGKVWQCHHAIELHL